MFEVGDEIIYISDDYINTVTKGKLYHVMSINDKVITIENDKKMISGYFSYRFKKNIFAPTKGDIIEVRDSLDDEWYSSLFFCFDGDSVICQNMFDCDMFKRWIYAKTPDLFEVTIQDKSFFLNSVELKDLQDQIVEIK